MVPSRPKKTAADYAAIAIGPVLIMGLVGSLAFFLMEVSYAGDYSGSVRWVLFWFVLASVLVSRISIEQGSAYAALYGIGLGGATGIMIGRFVDHVLGVWIILGLIWWCAGELTWDCTLIDEDEDASGEGLLQVAKSAKASRRAGASARAGSIPEPPTAPAGSAPRKQRKASTAPVTGWRRVLGNYAERAGMPHAPGLWVVYFSLGALPVFGLGQTLLPANETARRTYGFALLLVYVVSAVGLLLTTSFLGLRRYLRQRYLQMPAPLAWAWMARGVALAAFILLASLLLPRPNASYSIPALVGRIGSPELDASQWALLRNDAGKGDGRRGLKPGEESDDQNRRPNAAGNDAEKSGRAAGTDKTMPTPTLATTAAVVANWLKWLFYALIVATLLYLAIRYRKQLLESLRQLWRELRELWFKLTHWGSSTKRPATTVKGGPRPARPFAHFRNPFTSGAAAKTPPSELVRYTFDAVQAWASERHHPRRDEQTPFEFAFELGRSLPYLAEDMEHLTRHYATLAYGDQPPPPESLEVLRRVWGNLTGA